MARFRHGAVEIDFLDEGEGDPIVLVHGFASTKEMNWVHPGWVSTLRRAGKRVVALDSRGHGRSTKLYRPADYTIDAMAACMRGSAHALPRAEIATIAVPILVAVGTRDDIAGPAQPLAAIIPGAQVLDIPERDHMRAVGDRVFKDGVLAFLHARA